MTLEESNDQCIKDARILIDGGSKADTREVNEAKSRLRMKNITGIANVGNEGLGWRKGYTTTVASRQIEEIWW